MGTKLLIIKIKQKKGNYMNEKWIFGEMEMEKTNERFITSGKKKIDRTLRKKEKGLLNHQIFPKELGYQ